MKFTVVIEKGEDGYFVVHCPVLTGCVSQGDSLKEALANIREAVEGILEVMRKHGMVIPKDSPDAVAKEIRLCLKVGSTPSP